MSEGAVIEPSSGWSIATLVAVGVVAVFAGTVLTLSAPGAAAVVDDPGEPITFYGTAEFEDGTAVPEDTVVVAAVDGDEVDRITVEEAGIYAGDDPTDPKLRTHTNAGDTVTFHLEDADGPAAAESHDVDESGVFELALTFPEEAADPDPDPDPDSDPDPDPDPDDDADPTPAPAPAPEPEPEPEDEPEETVPTTPIDGGLQAPVVDAPANEAVTIPTADEVGVDERSLSKLEIVPTEQSDFNLTVVADEGVPEDADELPDGTDELLSLAVDSTLEAEQIDSATFEFAVPVADLDALDVDGPEVVLYHEVDGEWVERDTDVQFPGDHMEQDVATIEAETPHFSAFVLAVDHPVIDIVDYSVSETELVPGDAVTVDVIVRNDGGAPGETDVTVTFDDVTETERVTLEPGETRVVTITHTADETGEFELVVDDAVEIVTVTTEETTTPDSDDEADDGIPGFGILAAVLALCVALVAPRLQTLQ